jgi:uncharacterized membrane protein
VSARSSSASRALMGAAFVGSASGLRSQMGMAGVLVGIPRHELPALFRRSAARPLAVTSAAIELVGDKLPSAPPRTQASGLVPRLVLGGLSAGLLARSASGPVIEAAAIGAGAAIGAAFAGISARTRLSTHLPPIAAALIEDLVAVALAATAVRVTAAASLP